MDAYDGSQRSRREGKLLEARKQLLACAQESCPAAVATQCTAWLREVDESLPTVVFAVREASGADVSSVRVTSGGALLGERLEGRAVALDPGPHQIVFELADGRRFEKAIVVRQGEKNRLIELALPEPRRPPPRAPAPSAPAPAERGVPTLSIVLGAVGVVALGSFAYFAIDAKSDVDDMEADCAPQCAQSRVDTAERKALVADISLGVGIAALAGAGIVFFAAPSPDRGAFAGVSGRF